MAKAFTGPVAVGMDVGSTTVKAVVVDPHSREILWSDYRRHETKQPEMVLEFMVRIGNAFPDVPHDQIRIFVTGSGSSPLASPLGGKFVQEVNAVTMAVESLHPDVGSVIELGGQDAKIIIFKENEETGQKQAITSMNDKCASGTGATIDKCFIKAGVPGNEVAAIVYNPDKLHHVAAKCGVFAETDIVNLVKSGIPSNEILNSLGDAIVMQNLSVLTRGNTLRPKVLLLGGPNTYLPFLQAAWRHRIPETWQSRGFDYPRDIPLEELILVPENAQYYAAFGAVMYGLYEPEDVGVYQGLQGLKDYMGTGRQARLEAMADRPLVSSREELEEFQTRYKLPKIESARFEPGTTIRVAIGVDGGSTSSKAAVVDEQGELLHTEYMLSKGNPIADTREILASIKKWATDQACDIEVLGVGATGYAGDVLEEAIKVDANIVETVAHMMSAQRFFPDVDVICDVGGQDIKVLFMQNGDVKNFRLSNQCSAGNGMLLQAMADQFGIPITEYADTAFEASLSPKFSYGCAVFLDSDRVNFQKEGFAKEELLAGLAMVLPKNIWQYVVQIPRMAELGTVFVLQGGTQHNLAAVKSQVDYINERVPGAEVHVHPYTGVAGAHGAAMEALRVVTRRGHSVFIGLDAAIDLRFSTRNDESTVCHFCPNLCSRTFIDTETPDGQTARYIAGFSCEKGTVESKEEMIRLSRERQKLLKAYPNLVDYEAKIAFKQLALPPAMPERGATHEAIDVSTGFLSKLIGSNLLARVTRSSVEVAFERSSKAEWNRRKGLRIGIPRVLNLYTTAPFFRHYFEALGVASKNVVFSDHTTEEMWQEGGKYGSIDPCYPSKVVQAHIHHLLFHTHVGKPLDYIFFPGLTHVPSPLKALQDTASCPIVAGTPNVMKAAFTKEVDFFTERGIKYLDPALTLVEPNFLKKQLYEALADELHMTKDESDLAVDFGFRMMTRFQQEMERRGRAILEQVTEENRVAVLLLCRPYHHDPGLNHGILEEFQVLGYPILSMTSVPKDEAWLRPYFAADLEAGRTTSPLDINDVWPENYSTNSATKVWAAKFAARHPNVVVLDLSSFKCGHDAPIYGMVDSIIAESKTPYSALHDIDANKPGGSIKIRVKTYANSLTRHGERLEDLAVRKAELQRRMEEKRRELMRRASGEPERSPQPRVSAPGPTA